MKTRNSLVSNSSSASFVILWKRIQPADETTHDLDSIFKGLDYDLSDVAQIKASSEMLADGIVRTKFWTSMMNTYADFGIGALELYIMLSMQKSQFILITADVDDDN